MLVEKVCRARWNFLWQAEGEQQRENQERLAPGFALPLSAPFLLKVLQGMPEAQGAARTVPALGPGRPTRRVRARPAKPKLAAGGQPAEPPTFRTQFIVRLWSPCVAGKCRNARGACLQERMPSARLPEARWRGNWQCLPRHRPQWMQANRPQRGLWQFPAQHSSLHHQNEERTLVGMRHKTDNCTPVNLSHRNEGRPCQYES